MAWTGLADKREACISGVSTFQNGGVFGVDDVRYFAERCNGKRVGWEGCFALPIQGLYGKADELGKSGYGLYPRALTIGLRLSQRINTFEQPDLLSWCCLAADGQMNISGGGARQDKVALGILNAFDVRFDVLFPGFNRPWIGLGIVTIDCYRDESISGFVIQIWNESDPFALIVGRFRPRVGDAIDLQLDLH
ncbi:hypothetical protein D3C71_1131660 [compost metagenome]